MPRKFGALSSSANPEQLSQTVNGLMILVVSGLSLYASSKGLAVAPADIQEQVSSVAMAVGTIWTSFGIIRKGLIWAYAAFFTKGV